MVHALQECWRVLKPDGHLIDLRPVGGSALAEVIIDGSPRSAGQLDDGGHLTNDVAATLALSRLMKEGWFARERRTEFDFAVTAETVEAALAGIGRVRSDISIPGPVQPIIDQLLAEGESAAQVRLLFKVQIARYRRLERAGDMGVLLVAL